MTKDNPDTLPILHGLPLSDSIVLSIEELEAAESAVREAHCKKLQELNLDKLIENDALSSEIASLNPENPPSSLNINYEKLWKKSHRVFATNVFFSKPETPTKTPEGNLRKKIIAALNKQLKVLEESRKKNVTHTEEIEKIKNAITDYKNFYKKELPRIYFQTILKNKFDAFTKEFQPATTQQTSVGKDTVSQPPTTTAATFTPYNSPELKEFLQTDFITTDYWDNTSKSKFQSKSACLEQHRLFKQALNKARNSIRKKLEEQYKTITTKTETTKAETTKTATTKADIDVEHLSKEDKEFGLQTRRIGKALIYLNQIEALFTRRLDLEYDNAQESKLFSVLGKVAKGLSTLGASSATASCLLFIGSIFFPPLAIPATILGIISFVSYSGTAVCASRIIRNMLHQRSPEKGESLGVFMDAILFPLNFIPLTTVIKHISHSVKIPPIHHGVKHIFSIFSQITQKIVNQFTPSVITNVIEGNAFIVNIIKNIFRRPLGGFKQKQPPKLESTASIENQLNQTPEKPVAEKTASKTKEGENSTQRKSSRAPFVTRILSFLFLKFKKEIKKEVPKSNIPSSQQNTSSSPLYPPGEQH